MAEIGILYGGGTVFMKGRAAAIVQQIVLIGRELQQHEFARITFNFDRSSMTTEMSSIGKMYFDKQGVVAVKNGT